MENKSQTPDSPPTPAQEDMCLRIPLRLPNGQLSGWWAVSCSNGTVVLQFLGAVLDAASRRIFDTAKNPNALDHIQHDNVYVRAIHLTPDGSVHCDPLGVSIRGLPTQEHAYVLMESAVQTFSRFHASLTVPLPF